MGFCNFISYFLLFTLLFLLACPSYSSSDINLTVDDDIETKSTPTKLKLHYFSGITKKYSSLGIYFPPKKIAINVDRVEYAAPPKPPKIYVNVDSVDSVMSVGKINVNVDSVDGVMSVGPPLPPKINVNVDSVDGVMSVGPPLPPNINVNVDSVDSVMSVSPPLPPKIEGTNSAYPPRPPKLRTSIGIREKSL